MPRAPSTLEFLPEAVDDLNRIEEHNTAHAQRIFDKVADWEDKIDWGRVPQERLTYLTDSPPEYSFYGLSRRMPRGLTPRRFTVSESATADIVSYTRYPET